MYIHIYIYIHISIYSMLYNYYSLSYLSTKNCWKRIIPAILFPSESSARGRVKLRCWSPPGWPRWSSTTPRWRPSTNPHRYRWWCHFVTKKKHEKTWEDAPWNSPTSHLFSPLSISFKISYLSHLFANICHCVILTPIQTIDIEPCPVGWWRPSRSWRKPPGGRAQQVDSDSAVVDSMDFFKENLNRKAPYLMRRPIWFILVYDFLKWLVRIWPRFLLSNEVWCDVFFLKPHRALGSYSWVHAAWVPCPWAVDMGGKKHEPAKSKLTQQDT